MMHPDDKPPYLSREQLFETIRVQRIELDRKDDYIRKLEAGFTLVEAGSWEGDHA